MKPIVGTFLERVAIKNWTVALLLIASLIISKTAQPAHKTMEVVGITHNNFHFPTLKINLMAI